jgi:hypothetical protein
MMYVVQVDQNALRARSDPLPAATALKVAKAWQSHGDRGVQIMEAGPETPDRRAWTIRDFIAFTRESSGRKRLPRLAADAGVDDVLEATTGA